jgi:hypothetical protein
MALAPVALALMVPGSSPVRAHLFTFFSLGCLLVFLELSACCESFRRSVRRIDDALFRPLRQVL